MPGMERQEIAQLVGTTVGTVSVEVSNLKKAKVKRYTWQKNRRLNWKNRMRALLLVNLEPLKQKQQITILDKAGLGRWESRRSSGSTPKAVSVRLAEIRKEARKGKSK